MWMFPVLIGVAAPLFLLVRELQMILRATPPFLRFAGLAAPVHPELTSGEEDLRATGDGEREYRHVDS
jgi:hypothetical protein